MKEFFGRDEREALEKAALALGKKPAELKYVLIENLMPSMKRGVTAAIAVETVDRQEDKVPGLPNQEEENARLQGGEAWICAWCAGVLRRMGFAPRIALERDGDVTVMKIDFDGFRPALNRGAMRGVRGAIQHLVGRITLQVDSQSRQYVVDLCGTMNERRQKMNYLAAQLKRHLDGGKKWLGVHLMESQDRSFLHTALKNAGVKSESRGEGQFRVIEVRKTGKR